MSKSGWDEMLCNYFYDLCIRVLGRYFYDLDFVPQENKIGGVVFKNKDVFVEISYSADSFPNYFLRIVVGVGSEAYNEQGQFTGIPLWSVISEDSEESNFFGLTFSNEKELEDMLEYLRSHVLEKYMVPLWQDSRWLEKEQKRFSA